MKNISIWSDIKTSNYKSLDKDIDVDILIIGGGMTGVSSLYHLRNCGLKIALVEQNKIGMGVTSKSTGKLCYLQNDLIDKIRTFYSDKIASIYLNSQIETINNMIKVINDEKIDCNLEKTDAYLYTNNDKEIKKIKDLEKFLIKNNINIDYDNVNLVKSKYMIKVDDTYLIHPVKFINGLLKNNQFPIYENTSIKKIEYKKNNYICLTEKNKIKAKKIILASHYPYFLIPFFFPLKVSLEKSYLSASKLTLKPISLISYKKPFISIRNYQDNIIYLSNSHSLNNHICSKDQFNELLKKLNDLNLNPEYLWSNIDIMTSDGMPYIGKLKKDVYIGTGYNTWGLTNGFLAGQILADLVLSKENKYQYLFEPKRRNIKHLPFYLSNIYKNISSFLKSYTSSKQSKYICPHLGCKLIYNEQEKTYDCSCHGSRFDQKGKCISAPANKDIKKK